MASSSFPTTIKGFRPATPEEAAALSQQSFISAPGNLVQAVMGQESAGNPTALSPKGAYGLMQLMPGTAAELGVDSSDPTANKMGGTAYLARMLDKYGGNVEHALMAYNWGPHSVDKWLAAGGTGAIPAETQDYVKRIMAKLGPDTAASNSDAPMPQAANESLTSPTNESGPPKNITGPDGNPIDLSQYRLATTAEDKDWAEREFSASGMGALERGLAGGTHSLASIGGGIVAAVGDLMSAQGLQDWGVDVVHQYQRSASQYLGRSPSLEEVFHSEAMFSDFLSWAGSNIGSGAVTTVPVGLAMLVPGAGEVVAAGVAYGMGVGDIYGTSLGEDGRDASATLSAALGVPYAIAEYLFGAGAHVAKSLVGNSSRSAASTYLGRLAKEIPKTAAGEGTAEFVQQVITGVGAATQQGRSLADYFTDPETWKQAGEAGAAGMIGGGPFGAISAIPKGEAGPPPGGPVSGPPGATMAPSTGAGQAAPAPVGSPPAQPQGPAGAMDPNTGIALRGVPLPPDENPAAPGPVPAAPATQVSKIVPTAQPPIAAPTPTITPSVQPAPVAAAPLPVNAPVNAPVTTPSPSPPSGSASGGAAAVPPGGPQLPPATTEAGTARPPGGGPTADLSGIPTRLFHGTGRTDQKSAYEGPAVPILGEGRYSAFNKEDASRYGPTIEEGDLALKNPMIIRSDEQWRALAKEAGWGYPNPSGIPEAEIKTMTAALQNLVRKKGHDGIIVWWDDRIDGDMDPKTGAGIKTLRNVFGEPQVVEFGPGDLPPVGQQASPKTQAPTPQPSAPDEQQIAAGIRAKIKARNEGPVPIRLLAEQLGTDVATVRKHLDAMVAKGEGGIRKTKEGQYAKRPKTGPLDLYQFLKSRGGIKGSGDLEMITGGKRTAMWRELVRAEGLDPDAAREAAVEAGYLPEGATVRDLYDAMDRHSRGQKVYSESDATEVAEMQAKEQASRNEDLRQEELDKHRDTAKAWAAENGYAPLNDQELTWAAEGILDGMETDDAVDTAIMRYVQSEEEAATKPQEPTDEPIPGFTEEDGEESPAAGNEPGQKREEPAEPPSERPQSEPGSKPEGQGAESTEGTQGAQSDEDTLAAIGITVAEKKTPTGRKVWILKGEDRVLRSGPNRKTIKQVGGSWYHPTQEWTFYNGDPTRELAESFRSQPKPAGKRGSSGKRPGPVAKPDVTPRFDSGGTYTDTIVPPNAGRARGVLEGDEDGEETVSSTVKDEPGPGAPKPVTTVGLLKRGLAAGIPADIIQEQITDAGLITLAYEDKLPAFILAAEAGTGKTYVLGAAIREMRRRGQKSFRWVTMNKKLIKQIRTDLADFDLTGVSFQTYNDLANNGMKDIKGSVLIFDEAHNIKNVGSGGGIEAAKAIPDARMTVFSSATPFENPTEALYMAPTGIFTSQGTTFKEWAVKHGAVLRGKGENARPVWPGRRHKESLAARKWFVDRNMFIFRKKRLPPEMVEAKFTAIQASKEYADLYHRVDQAYQRAGEYAESESQMSQLMAHRANTLKRVLEATKMDEAVERTNKHLDRGRHVIIFVETKADRQLHTYQKREEFRQGPFGDTKRYTYPQIREIMDEWRAEAAIAKQMGEAAPPSPFAKFIEHISRGFHEEQLQHELPSVKDYLAEQIGTGKVALYTGDETDRQANDAIDDFYSGKKTVFIATMAKGGTGLSLHDKVGDKPRSMIGLNLPWKATGVDQVTGRPARYGMQSKTEIDWLFAENIPFERMLATRVGGRMADMGAVVKGVDLEEARKLATFDIEDEIFPPSGAGRHGRPGKFEDYTREFQEFVNANGGDVGVAIMPWLAERQSATGHEYMVLMNSDGTIFRAGTSNQADQVTQATEMIHIGAGPDGRGNFVLYHNHPSGNPLSVGDLAWLAYRLGKSIWVGSPEFHGASLTDYAHEKIPSGLNSVESAAGRLANIFNESRRWLELTSPIAMARRAGDLSQDEYVRLVMDTFIEGASQSGIFNYETSRDIALHAKRPIFKATVDGYTQRLRAAFDAEFGGRVPNGRAAHSNARLTQSGRHSERVEGLPGQPQISDASNPGGQGGDEGGAPNVERTEQGDQTVIPGAERRSDAEVAARKRQEQKAAIEAAANQKTRGKNRKAQEDPDESPLFGGPKQTSLFDERALQNMIRDEQGAPRVDLAQHLTPEELAALGSMGGKIGEKPKPLKQRLYQKLIQNFTDRFKQSVLDQQHGLKKLEKTANSGVLREDASSAAKLAQLTYGVGDIVHESLVAGVPVWNQGTVSIDTSVRAPMRVLEQAGDRALEFEKYIAARRARELEAQGKERLFSDEEIEAALKLGDVYPDFAQMWQDLQTYNERLLDFVEQSGLISGETKAKFLEMHKNYIPFWRVLEDDQSSGPAAKLGFAGQHPNFWKIKGSMRNVKDLFENLERNIHRLVEASVKNVVMLRAEQLNFDTGGLFMETLSAQAGRALVTNRQMVKDLEAQGVHIESTDDVDLDSIRVLWSLGNRPKGPNIVSWVRGGKIRYARVTDQFLYRSLSQINARQVSALKKMLPYKAARFAKNLLTAAIGLDPSYQVANYFRDNLHAAVISHIGYKPFGDGFKGLAGRFKNDADWKKMLAAGGGMSAMFEAEGAGRGKLLLRRVQKMAGKKPNAGEMIVDSVESAIAALQHFESSFEYATRLGAFKKLLAQGKPLLEAAYQARIVSTDFAQRGDSQLLGFFLDTVPFLNAGIQGLYRTYEGAGAPGGLMTKRGRENRGAAGVNAAKKDFMRFVLKGSILTAMSIAMFLRWKDDERYKELEDYQKDMYWHWWIGDLHLKAPKPFEVGAVFGTIPERAMQLAIDGNGEDFAKRMLWVTQQMFRLDLVPALARPPLRVYANWDDFREREIIPSWLSENRLPEDQYDVSTRLSAIAMGRALGVSPKNVETIINGYLGAQGNYIMAMADLIMRQAGDFPPAPTPRFYDFPIVDRFVGDTIPSSTKYLSDFYKMRDEVEQIYGSIQADMKSGNVDRVRSLLADNATKVALRDAINGFGTDIAQINNLLRMTKMSKSMTADQKRALIDDLTKARNKVAAATKEIRDIYESE